MSTRILATLGLAACAQSAMGQTFGPEVIWPTGTAVSGLTLTGAASNPATRLMAHDAGFTRFARKGSGASAWVTSAVPGAAQAVGTPFNGVQTVAAVVGGGSGGSGGSGGGGQLLIGPKNRGMISSATHGETLSKANLGVWSGWFADFEWGIGGFATGSNAIYAFSDFEEGNFSNGHAGSWINFGSRGTWRSTDGGATWGLFNNGFPTWGNDPLAGVTFEQHRAVTAGGTLVLSYTNFEKLMRSTGGGAWQMVANRGGLPNFSDLQRVVNLAGMHAFDGQEVIALMSNAGVYRSMNGGLNFTLQTPGPIGNGGLQGDGLPERVNFTAMAVTEMGLFVAVDPQPNVLEFTDPPAPARPRVYPLYVSTDRGRTFRPYGTGLGAISQGVITDIEVFDGRVYVLTGGVWTPEGITGAGVLAANVCRADVARAGQVDVPDGAMTADDIIVFLGWYFGGNMRANVAGPNQGPVDSALTADDIIVFLGWYFAGC